MIKIEKGSCNTKTKRKKKEKKKKGKYDVSKKIKWCAKKRG